MVEAQALHECFGRFAAALAKSAVKAKPRPAGTPREVRQRYVAVELAADIAEQVEKTPVRWEARLFMGDTTHRTVIIGSNRGRLLMFLAREPAPHLS
jgi:hypothetical protein